jgi:hypothetical protein
MVLIFPYFFTSPKFKAIALYPFIILRDKSLTKDMVLLNHEKIHLRQQLELLIIPFYILYILEYCYRLIQYKNTFEAYRNISFEREAYQNESNFSYLNSRKFGCSWKYIYKK